VIVGLVPDRVRGDALESVMAFAVEAPLPVTVSRVSASVAVTVYVEPVTEILAIPEPLRVSVPPRSTEPLPLSPANDMDELVKALFGTLATLFLLDR